MFENLSHPLNLILPAIYIGIGATAIMDVWTLFLKVAFNVSGLNFAMVGRWIGHMPRGKLMHQGIVNSSPIANESLIGWTAHYVIGIIFAAALLLVFGLAWLNSPSLTPALAAGLITVAFPFCLMQPCFGMGIAATKLPDPHISQFKSLVAHSVFGMGLYFSALLGNKLF